jgi:hypothetical protein
MQLCQFLIANGTLIKKLIIKCCKFALFLLCLWNMLGNTLETHWEINFEWDGNYETLGIWCKHFGNTNFQNFQNHLEIKL